MNNMPLTVADVYGASSYDSSTYETSTASNTGSSTSTTPASTGTSLTNTGFDVLLAGTFACAIMFSALLVRFWKRPVKISAEA